MLPPALIADIAGGAYPAIINILLALRSRDQSGQGCKLDISMSDNLFTFLYWAMSEGEATGEYPGASTGKVAGGSPRYEIYRTRDNKFVAAAPLEQKFWENFCVAIELPAQLIDDSMDPTGVKRVVAERIATKTAAEWQARFAGKDLCSTIVASMAEGMADPHFRARGLFDRKVATDTGSLTAAPVPVVPAFRDPKVTLDYPRLGEGNGLLP